MKSHSGPITLEKPHMQDSPMKSQQAPPRAAWILRGTDLGKWTWSWQVVVVVILLKVAVLMPEGTSVGIRLH